MPRDINRHHLVLRLEVPVLKYEEATRTNLVQSEIPFPFWHNEWRDKPATCCIHMYRNVQTALDKEIVDSFDVFVFAGICRPSCVALVSFA